MTTDTKMTIDQDYIRSFASGNNEPNWFLELRLQALELSEQLPMPKPDKTRITNWNFTEFKKHQAEGKTFQSLADLPEAAQSVIDLEKEDQSLFVQYNQKNAYLSLSKQLKEQGVIFTDIFTALSEHGELVQKVLHDRCCESRRA